MLEISYVTMVIFISAIWIFIRAMCCFINKKIIWRRELTLLLAYICIICVSRFTFFPFGTVDGKIQPLIFNAVKMIPFRTNFVPFVHLFDYPKLSSALLNLLGNVMMFIPIGIIWPLVFPRLNNHTRIICAGVGFSLSIEILQLPFYNRVSDIDDLILNSIGFLIGYFAFFCVKKIKQIRRNHGAS